MLTIGLIAANVAVFLFQLQKPNDSSLHGQTAFQCEWGLVPDHLLHGGAGPVSPVGTTCQELNAEHDRYAQLFTSQFLHGSWLHLLGNMLFLWVFGNNVEDRLGRIRFLPFYLLCGAIAGISQALVAPSEHFPLIGASGAIAGVLGAYIVLYPHARVWALLFIIPVVVPAWLMLGVWFLYQFLYAAGQSQEGGGVAYWAHVGGFIAGAVLIIPFLVGRQRPPPPVKREPVW